MQWIAIFFDRLSLEAVQPNVPSGSAAPALALCDRRHILAVDDAACALGIRAGMKRSAASALAPGLSLHERDAGGERVTLQALASWALQFTPLVSLQSDRLFEAVDAPHAPCGLVLDVTASLRYFRGLRPLLDRIRQGLSALRVSYRLGCAPTAGAAWLLARHRDGLVLDDASLKTGLGRLPAALLARSRPQHETLDAIGLRSIRDLTALPRAGLARRLGHEMLQTLDCAWGRRAEPRQWFEAPAEFELRLELPAAIEQAQALEFAGRRMLNLLVGWLAARQAGLRDCTFDIEHADRTGGTQQAKTAIALQLADPSRDLGRLALLLREKLAITRLPAPARALRLHCAHALPLPCAAGHGELFPAPGPARENVARLLERLQARLGVRQVQRLRLAADHRPERAYRIDAAETLQPSAGTTVPGADTLIPIGALPRPLWLLEQPIALIEHNQRLQERSPLTLLAGPERIETGWWDDALVQRDYFIAEDAEHRLLWIYRERQGARDDRSGWFIHGRFG